MRAIHRGVTPVLAVVLALTVAACVPTESTGLREVDDGSGVAGPGQDAPTFPDIGNVPDESVVEGLTYDFTVRPRDQDYWSPSGDEARCAAERFVAALGPERIVGLGYRPGTAGASVNDIELREEERQQLVDAFVACVDLVEGVSAILYGSGRVPTRMATCVARGLGQEGAVPLIEAWASGRAVDPFANDSAFASDLLAHTEVCVADTTFDWPDLRLPSDDSLIDSDAPAGSSGSGYVDDVRGSTSTTPTTP